MTQEHHLSSPCQINPLEDFHLAKADATDYAEECNDCKDNPDPGIIPHPEKPGALSPDHAIDEYESPNQITARSVVFPDSFALCN